MTSNTRIPKAELTGVYGWLVKRMSRKMLGDVAEPVEVAWHNRKVLNFSFAVGRRAQKWDACDENLKSLAHMAAVSHGRLQLLPGPRLLHGAQRGPGRGEGTRGAALARVDGVHPARARRHGVRGGDDADPADGHRRAVRAAAGAARRRRRWSS